MLLASFDETGWFVVVSPHEWRWFAEYEPLKDKGSIRKSCLCQTRHAYLTEYLSLDVDSSFFHAFGNGAVV